MNINNIDNTDNTITKTHKLCKSYGFKELSLLIYIPQFILSDFSLEYSYQQLKLLQLFQLCEKGTAIIESTVTKPQEGIMKGTKYKANVDIDWLEELTIQTLRNEIYGNLHIFKPVLLRHGIDIKNIKPDDIADLLQIVNELKTHYSFTNNAIMGWYLYDLYEDLSEKDFFPKDCTEIKKYSFLYDWCVLIEKANDLGYGFSGSIGKEKYTQVKNWIKAFKTQQKAKI